MLVLTRKVKQQIQIGPDITITILQLKGQAVRVGIEAPREICVLRTELAAKLSNGSDDPTVMAALGKKQRESEISSTASNEDTGGRTLVTLGSNHRSLRCRAPREDVAPVSSVDPSMGPASFLRPRRRRLSMH